MLRVTSVRMTVFVMPPPACAPSSGLAQHGKTAATSEVEPPPPPPGSPGTTKGGFQDTHMSTD